MTTIQEAVDWITALHNFHHGFDHFQRFMASQGDPQDQLRTIHVAGTNGKGSTVSYLANVLREAGYTVGTFTSPHLVAHQAVSYTHLDVYKRQGMRPFHHRNPGIFGAALNLDEL